LIIARQTLLFCNNREAKFKAAAPQLFGQAFAKDASDYLDQLATIRKAKARSSQPVFRNNKNRDFNPMVMEAPRAEARAVVHRERAPNDC